MTELKHNGKLSIGTNSNIFKDFVKTMGVADYQALEKSTRTREESACPHVRFCVCLLSL